MSQRLPTAILGRTGIEVTRLGFGTALWRPDRHHWTEEAASELYNEVLDHGINFIDTAYDYMFAEDWIGRNISDRYDEFHLATKCGCTDTQPDRNSSLHSWTGSNFLRNIEGSLERLGRESVDIIQPHNPTVAEVEGGGLVDAMREMRDSGKVRHLGISTTLPYLPTFLDWDVFDTMQIPYSALEREHEDWITKAAEAGVGIIISCCWERRKSSRTPAPRSSEATPARERSLLSVSPSRAWRSRTASFASRGCKPATSSS